MKSSTSENLCRRFSFAELNLTTGDFSDENVIGKGGFGKVYKGFIDNKRTTAVAIKRRLASNPSLGQAEFAAEIETLSKFRHDNLVSLIGFWKKRVVLTFSSAIERISVGKEQHRSFMIDYTDSVTLLFICNPIRLTDDVSINCGSGGTDSSTAPNPLHDPVRIPPVQKILLLHFYTASYKGFQEFS
ncbi:proline-rich receptor-like protein kinase PERK8 [Salvia hispanica]|uniref:proline-rich receptor-like protein kinase PERK8 n=1 Tax=Salvia hispanica TaxID=49212 RepID=UPI0020091DFB|nr:proline-rich receptor-like protein kinase PERK8 [Salvia hispanica]